MPERDDPPRDWAATTLGTVCKINPPRSTSRDTDANTLVTFVPMAAVNAASGKIDRPILRRFDEVRRGYTAFSEGDVLVAKITPCMENGKAAVARDLSSGVGFGSTEFHVLRPSNGILADYILRYVRQGSFRHRAQTNMTGSVGQLRVPQEFLDDAPILVPPIEEQRRILGIIDGAQIEVDGARASLERARSALADFQQVLLAAACTGRLTAEWRARNPATESASESLTRLAATTGPHKTRRGVMVGTPIDAALAASDLPMSWCLQTVSGLLVGGALVDVKDGNHGANHPKTREFTEEGLPFIMAAHVADFAVKYDLAPKVSGAALDRLRVGFARAGDVLLTHKGTVGRVAMNDQDCVLTPQTTYYRPCGDVFDAQYLMWYLASPQFYRQLAGVMSQTTRDFVPISEQYRLTIVMPPILEQREIGRQVRHALEAARTTTEVARDTAHRLDQAFEGILAKAFRGELSEPLV